ncbi:hypothetical protein [Streptomyces sp. NBC_00620]|uniref:hypothetical protein n=1 Tax=Streptomyces sp. NBC_00620 TaxID=2903666 RepID=UPI002254917B|nr:hypothetical protein [Streptomyces sp. NBC_00620]MCX4972572.1 hypothetical protein [Streptomyces sp. NBC_00620]
MERQVAAWDAALLVMTAGCGSSGGAKPARTVTQTITETATATAEPARTVTKMSAAPTVTVRPKPKSAAATIPGEGTHVVGTDIKSGVYRTAGASDPGLSLSYWARLEGTSGDFDEIIANGTTTGQTTFTVKATDGAFVTPAARPGTRSAEPRPFGQRRRRPHA